jgi:S1-C subfamily serine protease
MRANRLIAAALAAGLAITMLGGQPAGASEPEARADDEAITRELEQARRALAEAARRVAELSAQHADRVLSSVELEKLDPVSVRLGVRLGDDAGQADGVRIAAVEPGGPAAAAGLQADDLLLELNGRSLGDDPSRSALGRIHDALRGLDPGDRVEIAYRRGNRSHSASATLEAAPPRGHAFRFGVGDGHRHVIEVPDLARMFDEPVAFLMARPWSDLELVRVSEGLGRYFDTDKGLLVVRAPAEGALQLMDGDVILSIDGREPQSPTHAVRILRSYGPGERVAIAIVRDRRRQTIEAVIPERMQAVFRP